MPLVIDDITAHDFRTTGISVLSRISAAQQEILPVRLLLLDLDGAGGEVLSALLALLSNTPLQVDLSFTPRAGAEYDGLVAWSEQPDLRDDLPASPASLLIGEAARSALRQRHGIVADQLTRPLAESLPHQIAGDGSPLVAGQEPVVTVPVARTWRIGFEAVSAVPGLEILAHSPKAGVHLIHEPAIRRLYVLNQLALTPLGYARRLRRLSVAGDPASHPPDHLVSGPGQAWRSHAHLLVSAWLNSDVYQPASLAAWLQPAGSTPAASAAASSES